MGKRRTISAIDVGTTKVCTLIAEVGDNGQMRIAGVGTVPSKGMHKGMVVNINEAKETVRDSVKRAEQSSGYRVESAYIGVTGRHIHGQNNSGVVAVTRNDRLVRPDDLRRVLQNAQSVKMGSEQKILHMIPRHYAVDGQEGVQNPVGNAWFQTGCGNARYYYRRFLSPKPGQMHSWGGSGCRRPRFRGVSQQ